MSTNLDKLMQMATLEQLNNLIQQMSKQSAPVPVPVSQCDAKDVLSLPIVQKVIIAYEDELKLNKSSNNCSCSCDELIPTILERLDNHSLKLQLIENRLNDLFALLENKESKQEELMVDKNQPKLTSFPGFGLSQKQEDEDCLESPCLESPCLESPCLESPCLEKENITLNIEETEPENNNIDIIEDFDEDIQESTDTDTNSDTDVVDQVQIEDVKEDEDEETVEDEEVEVDESVEENEEDEEAAEDAVAIEDEEVEVDEEADTDDSTEDEVATNEDQDQVQTVEEEEEEEEQDQVQTVEEDVEEEEEEEDSEEVFEIEIDDVTYFATDEENGILYEVDKDGEVGKKVGIIKDGEPIFS
jgi:hypothetical protein